MSKVYLPTAEQMDTTLYNLSRIAGALGDKADVSTWAGIERAVKSGIASQLFPIGTQFTVSHSVYGDMVYDVVAHDYFKSVGDENAHTMTLMSHDLLPSMQVDNREAFYYAESELPIGAYSFIVSESNSEWLYGGYHFILTKPLPKGGQLFIDGYPSQALNTLNINSYASPSSTEIIESVPIITSNLGLNLGTLGIQLNNISRCNYGSNNYKESAIRQFLNSSAEAGSVWSPQTKYDRPPYWMTSRAGFMNGLDADFLAVIGKVTVPCSTNKTYESPDSTVTKNEKYTVTDKFYLASQKEIIGTIDNSVDDGSYLFPFYKNAIASDRIKYRDSAASIWRTRTASASGTSGYHSVQSNGMLISRGASDEYGIAPVCTIV